MRQYTVNANRKDFKPNPIKQAIPKRIYKMRLDFDLGESLLEDAPPDQWNKLGGFTGLFPIGNNAYSFLIGYMSLPEKRGLLLTGYVNSRDKRFDWGRQPLKVQPGKVSAEIVLTDSIDSIPNGTRDPFKQADMSDWVADFSIGSRMDEHGRPDEYRQAFHIEPPRCRLFREIGGYYGGRVPSSERRKYRMSTTVQK